MFLQRVRRKVPLGRAQQLDSACLSWLIKKPGRTAIEKAGSSQEILAVVREESFDTLENRILKDFLRRAGRAGVEYQRDCAEYRGSARFKTVEKFSCSVARYAKHEVFNRVRSVSSASMLRRDFYMGVPIRDIIGGFGADLAVVVTGPDQTQFSLWIIWAIFGGSAEADGIAEADSLARLSALIREVAEEHSNLRAIHGVLMTGSLHRSDKRATGDVSMLSVGQNYLTWKEREFPETKKLIRRLIQTDTWLV